MAGGGEHWWNYIVMFNCKGEQVEVFVQNRNGIKHKPNKKLIVDNSLTCLKLVSDDYQLKDDEDFLEI